MLVKSQVPTKSIHISDVRSFRSCRRKWEWSSSLKGNLEPLIPYAPFFTGRAIHSCLEFYYRDNIPFDQTLSMYLKSEADTMQKVGEMWNHEKTSFNEQLDLIDALLQHYSLWVAQDHSLFSDENLEFISLETPFEIPMPTGKKSVSKTMTLGGRFDGVVRHKPTGKYWIWETKTTRGIQELTRSLSNDEQSGLYIYAASKALKVPIVGVIYNMMKKKAPAVPKILQNGSLSKAKNVDTTSFAYKAEIRSMFPSWSEETIHEQYGDVISSLKESDQDFFMRFPVYRSQHEIDQLLIGIYETAKEMTNPKLALYPSPSWLNCNFCIFKSPCITKNAGGAYQVLLNEEYQQRVSQTSVREIPDE